MTNPALLTKTATFCRVTKQRPCVVCQKPDWCVFRVDGALSVCMRVRTGAVKINRQGGAIFLHDLNDTTPPGETLLQQPSSANRLAPIAVRDFAYRWLIERSPATRYPTLLNGSKGLLARGFNAVQLSQYGALPRSLRERDQLTRQLLRALCQQFPDCTSLIGVPGFWEDEHGAAHLWQPRLDCAIRLVIPVRDETGRIQACQLRNGRTRGARYCWLSSAKWPNGVGSGSPLHFNFALDALPRGEAIWIVEGFLKADAFGALRPDTPIIATGGVAANHTEIIRHTAGRPVVIAFDQDYRSNETVCLQLARLIAGRIASEGTADTTCIATWHAKAKGIDDAALWGLPIAQVSCVDWLHRLPAPFRQQVIAAWRSQRIPRERGLR